MKEGDIVLYQFVQSDGLVKKRPALVLRFMPPFDDLLICGISTQLRQTVVNFDEIINRNESYFAQTGLISTSLIRLGFLGLVPLHDIEGKIGEIPSEIHAKLLRRLASYLIENV